MIDCERAVNNEAGRQQYELLADRIAITDTQQYDQLVHTRKPSESTNPLPSRRHNSIS